MTGILFVTAPEADHRIVNRALWYLRDLQYGTDDRFHLVGTRNVADLKSDSDYDREVTSAGSLREESFSPEKNPWASASLEEVENFVLSLEEDDGNLGVSTYVIVDGVGAKDKTCIIGHKVFDDSLDEEYEWRHKAKFDKVRGPWDETYMMWCNLDIGNMDFSDFCDQDNGPSEDGWWKWASIGNGSELSEENREERDAEIEKLEQEGNA